MADGKKDVFSEHTKGMTLEQMSELQEKTGSMSEGELREFRNSFDPDSMGFFGEESV